MLSDASAGLVPDPVPLDGLTEIRVHGVGGTRPETMLGDSSPTRVAGDRVAGFYRTRDARGRHREAYSWGGLTSYARTRALWAFLLPAMFANMAGWMARRLVMSGEEEQSRPPTNWVFRWAARLSALALTVSTAVIVSMMALDMLAYQCGNRAECLLSRWPADSGSRLVVGAVAAALVALAFYALAWRSRSHYERVEPPTPISADQSAMGQDAEMPEPGLSAAARPGGLRDPGFWAGAQWHVHLSRLHLAASLSVVAALLGWSVFRLDGGEGLGTAVGRTALVAVVMAVLALVAVLGMLARDRAAPKSATALAALAAAALVLGLIAAQALPTTGCHAPSGALPGMDESATAGWLLTLFLLVPLSVQQFGALISRWFSRHRTTQSPVVEVFPLAGPAVMNAVAMVVASTVQLSVFVYVARAIGDPAWGDGPTSGSSAAADAIWIPPAVGRLAAVLSAGLAAVLLVSIVALPVLVYVTARKRERAVELDLQSEYLRAGIPDVPANPQPRSEDAWWRSAFDPPGYGEASAETANRPSKWVRKVSRMRVIGERSRLLAWLFVAIAVVGLVGTVLALFPDLVPIGDGLYWQSGCFKAAMGLIVLLPPVYVLILFATFREERWRRLLGVLFDVGTFFPRSFHPFAPPSYSERAVPELTRRVWRLHDNGGRVVLTAHSQGSVIAAAVVGRRSGRPGVEPGVGLVTFGSPLSKLYRWAFPALFSDGFLAGLGSGQAGIGPLRWRNLAYETDYVGGPLRTGGSTIPEGIDVDLVDPPTHLYVFDQPLPSVLSHTGYWYDPALWRHVDAMCDAIVPPAEDAPPVV